MDIAKRMLSLSAARATGGLIQTVTFVFIARASGPTEFGVLLAVFAVSAFACVLGDLGSSSLSVQQWAKGQLLEANRTIRLTSWPILIASSVAAAFPIFLGTAETLDPIHFISFTLVGLGVGLEKLTENRLSLLVAEKRIGSAWVSIVGRRVVALAIFLLATPGLGPGLAFGLSLLSAGLVGLALSPRNRSKAASVVGSPSFKATVRLASPYLLANLGAQMRTLDVVITGAFAGLSQAGFYAAAQRIVNPLFLISTSVMAVLFPHSLANSQSHNRKLLYLLLAVAAACSVLGIILAPFTPSFMVLLFGSEFGPAAEPFAVLLIAIGPLLFAGPMQTVIQGAGFSHHMAVLAAVLAPVTIASLIAGAIVGGATGASFALAAVASLRLLLTFLMGLRLLRV